MGQPASWLGKERGGTTMSHGKHRNKAGLGAFSTALAPS